MIVLDISSWIQAGAAVALVILTGWTLAVLRRYAADTKIIADASASQAEKSQMPFIAVRWHEWPRRVGGERLHQEGWSIQNQGFGPALNIRCIVRTREGKQQVASIAALANGDFHSLHQEIANAFNASIPFLLEYTSLSGQAYRSTVELVNNESRTSFEALALPKMLQR